jgi:UDP-4-amino-4,6-dideoxy-N-acetyl-beta-L-altrosamine N-acetyltransferase
MVHADLERVLAWRNHPDIRRYMYTQHEIILEEHQRWFERSLPDPKIHLLIFEVDQQPLGFVKFNETEKGGIADWGFYVAPDSPKGSGRQLGCAALGHAFTQIKLHKVCGQALAYNQRSIQLHLGLGFQQEGTLRDQHFDGERYHHVNCFGLISTEWQPQKKT